MITLLLELLPWLASSVAGGRAGEIATIGAKVAKEVFGTSDVNVISDRLASDPALAEQFKARLEADLETVKAGLADVQHAREQSVELVRAGSFLAAAPAVLSALVILGFVGITTGLLFKAVPDSQIASILVGTLAAGFVQVLNYWLGSSSGSRAKDGLLAGLAVAPAKARAK